MQKQLVVIGGGAAGFFCAVNAARMNPTLKVIILEKSGKLLSKVKVSGGGRCNVTHACFEINELIKRYPRGQNFLKKAFHWFNTNHTIEWFEERGVTLKTEADGRMFPITNSSQTIIDCLISEANKYKVEIRMHADVKSIHSKDGQFSLQLSNENVLTSDFLCIACGGYPKASQFEWLTETAHTIATPVPSLFTFNMPGNPITQLPGVSVESAIVKIEGSKLKEQGPLLITHWGMSGPAILKLSAWGARELAEKNYNFKTAINWLPAFNENTLREEWQYLRSQHAAQKISSKNPFGLPNRLWAYLLNVSDVNEELRWAEVPAKAQNKLIQNLTNQTFEVSGKTTFKEEFVTSGGIQLSEIDVNTMQSKLIENLFFAGEIINVDGITGGFNFQNAWTTGWLAAKAVTGKMI